MQENSRLYLVFIVIGVLAILLSTCFGACAGGIVGYWAGRQAANTLISKRPIEEWKRAPIGPEEPRPWAPQHPPLVPETGGALVTEVVDGSPADQAGIQPGDVIIAVDDVPVEGEYALQRLIRRHRPGERVMITLWRQGRERAVRARLTGHPEDREVAYLGVFYQMQRMRVEPPQTD